MCAHSVCRLAPASLPVSAGVSVSLPGDSRACPAEQRMCEGDSGADRKPARCLASCPPVAVPLASARAGVWAQDEVAALRSPQLSGESFPGAPGAWPRVRGLEADSPWGRDGPAGVLGGLTTGWGGKKPGHRALVLPWRPWLGSALSGTLWHPGAACSCRLPGLAFRSPLQRPLRGQAREPQFLHL